ncbi:hypothetical protein R3I94_000861 [Phoxinus phoxinus]
MAFFVTQQKISQSKSHMAMSVQTATVCIHRELIFGCWHRACSLSEEIV